MVENEAMLAYDDTFRLDVEQAALNAWPGVEQEFVMGWEARFAGGHTKRANSVSPLPPLVLLPERIAACEAVYANHGQPTIFKIPDFIDPTVDRLLEQRGYTLADPTLVLVRPLAPRDEQAAPAAPKMALQQWLPAWARCNGQPEPHAAHRMILENRLAHAVYTCVSCTGEHDADEACSCGIGVLDDGPETAHGRLFGIFDVATREAERRRGHATRLVRSLLAAGARAGASLSYLQVVRTNTAARKLYESLGFVELYGYWYRIQPEQPLANARPEA